jgi:hypothetical protein
MRVTRMHLGAAGACATVLAGAVVLSSGAASAKNNQDLSDIAMIDTCPQMQNDVRYKADSCSFAPTSYESYQTGFYLPQGDENAWNCSSQVADHTWQLTDVRQQTNSLGITAQAGIKLIEVVTLSLQATYGHEWMTGTWQWTGNTEHIAPGKVGWMEMSTEMFKIHGNWEMHYGDPVAFDKDGNPGGYHYFWTLFDYTQTDDKKDGTHNVVYKDRDMTQEEKDRICGNNGLGPGQGPPGLRKQVVDPNNPDGPGLMITPLEPTEPSPS